MSLLMDALKRAEKAREAQAEKAAPHDSSRPPATELALDPMEVASGERRAPRTPAPAATGTGTEDSLELTPDDVKRQIESIENTDMTGVIDGLGGLELEKPQSEPAARVPFDDSLSLEYGDVPLDETGSTLPSVRAAQRSVQDYFDGTNSMSMSLEEVRDTVGAHRDAAQSEAQAGDRSPEGNTTAQRHAQAVVGAGVRAPSRSGRNVALLLIFLLLIGGVGGGAFLFKDKIMAMLDGKPPLVAQRQPRSKPPSAAAPVPTPSASTEKALAAERDALLRAAGQARAEEAARAQAQADVDAKLRAAAQMQAQTVADAAAAQATLQAEVEALRRGAAEHSASAAAAATRGGAGMQASAAADAMTAPSAFKISKRRGPGRTHTQLVSAFDFFQGGEDGRAMQIYLTVLKREPRNRDALLGAAAVSLRAGANEQAASYYAEVLRRNPRDGAAQTALIALQDNYDPVAGESRVKDLLTRKPADANLHFALGNLYAEQGRWAEAQQSYFEAYRLDNTNPDYAFNLAVSLDQLAQSKPALDYYRRAEELATELPATFDPAIAQRRAAQLSGS